MYIIGKLGFAALARNLGFAHVSRREALARLVAAGKLRLPGPPAPTPEEVEDLGATRSSPPQDRLAPRRPPG